jgi:hypothetical protein
MLKQAKGEVGETFFVFGDFVVQPMAAALDNLPNPGAKPRTTAGAKLVRLV